MLLRNKLIIIAIFVLLAIPVISDNQYEQVGTVLQCLKRSLYDFLINPNSPEVRPKEEIIDLINFYLGINPAAITVDVSGKAPEPPTRQTNKTIREILGSIPNCEFPASCIDGTKYAECSTDQPKYCYAGQLIDRCDKCGCNSGDYCNTATYQCQSSSDYIACQVESICSSSDYLGSSDYIERRYCIGNGVYRNYTKAVCINPNKPDSYCDNQRIPVLLETCDEGCYLGECTPFIPISTCQELQNMQNDLDGGYELMNDIDCSATSGWNGGQGFKPIGINYPNRFTGTLDGKGHSITGLYINRPSEYIGLFGVLGNGALVFNVKLENVNVVGDPAGAIVGLIVDGTLDKVSSSGQITKGGLAFGGGATGGLVGQMNKGFIIDSFSESNVQGGVSHTGGILGAGLYSPSTKEIKNSYSTGNVDGRQRVGGLVGHTQGVDIYDSYSTSKVTANDDAGGLVGFSLTSSIINSYSSGDIDGWTNVGGLVGRAEYSTIEDSSSTRIVRGIGNQVGGLVGKAEFYTKIKNSHSTGDVTGTGIENVGGLVGQAYNSIITDSHSKSDVNGVNKVGGLVGYASTNTVIKESYSEASTITGTNNEVGGLVGYLGTSSIENSYSVSTVNGNQQIGGLVGKTVDSSITNSFSTGNINVGDRAAGGLVGGAQNSNILNSYATGELVGGSSYLGGLIGIFGGTGTITNAYWSNSKIVCCGLGTCTLCTSQAPKNVFYDPTHNVYDTEGPQWDFVTPIWVSNNPTNYPTLS